MSYRLYELVDLWKEKAAEYKTKAEISSSDISIVLNSSYSLVYNECASSLEKELMEEHGVEFTETDIRALTKKYRDQ